MAPAINEHCERERSSLRESKVSFQSSFVFRQLHLQLANVGVQFVDNRIVHAVRIGHLARQFADFHFIIVVGNGVFTLRFTIEEDVQQNEPHARQPLVQMLKIGFFIHTIAAVKIAVAHLVEHGFETNGLELANRFARHLSVLRSLASTTSIQFPDVEEEIEDFLLFCFISFDQIDERLNTIDVGGLLQFGQCHRVLRQTSCFTADKFEQDAKRLAITINEDGTILQQD
jgi:hypothetical protein